MTATASTKASARRMNIPLHKMVQIELPTMGNSADAYLWFKTLGEHFNQCGVFQGSVDINFSGMCEAYLDGITVLTTVDKTEQELGLEVKTKREKRLAANEASKLSKKKANEAKKVAERKEYERLKKIYG